ncbi:MAG: lytic transglycosylase domain-containing protein, partial [Candidatus Aenigmatarchaeota archaeon]
IIDTNCPNLNPNIVYCMITAESDWDPKAIAGKGKDAAYGLMQIKLSLWENYCKKYILNFKWDDPIHNTICGVKILCDWANRNPAKYGTITKKGSRYDKCMKQKEKCQIKPE